MSNEEVWKRTNHEPINIIIKEENGSGLVTLLENLRMTLPRQALEWNPAGKRRRGRARQTW
jgi:hypothetical protein